MVTVKEANQIPDNAFVYAQNVEIGSGGAFGPRLGCSLFGNNTTGGGKILSTETFRLRSGEEFPLRLRTRPASTSILEFYNVSANAYQALSEGYSLTARARFVSWNTSDQNRMYMGNGVDAFTKIIAEKIVSNTAAVITIGSDSALAGFAASGTVYINGTAYTYTGLSGSTLTGFAALPAITAGDLIWQISTPGGVGISNVMIAHLSRLWIARGSAFYYSKTGLPEDFTVTGLPGSGGIEDFPEGGGKITGFGSRDDVLVIMKQDILRTFQFNQPDLATNEIPVSKPLGFSADIGPQSPFSLTSVLKEIFYSSRRYGPRQLTQVVNATAGNSNQANSLDVVPIGDAIAPTIKGFPQDDAASGEHDQKVLTACKSDSAQTGNDIIIVYDNRVKGMILYKGWNVNDFFKYGGDLYYGSSTQPNCFKCFDGYTDNGGPIESIVRTKQYDFGEPAIRKEDTVLFIGGSILDGTDIEITLNIDEDGGTKQIPKEINWDGIYVKNSIAGTEGYEELASNPLAGTIDDADELNPFKVYPTLPAIPHYNLDLIIKCTSLGGRWKIKAIGFNPKAQKEPAAGYKI